MWRPVRTGITSVTRVQILEGLQEGDNVALPVERAIVPATKSDPCSHKGMQDVRERIRSARSICVLTGAGISAESGIPTFRGFGGLWRNFKAEDLATPEAFERDPKLVWEWYDRRRGLIAKAQPNPGHYAAARFPIITQNVDELAHARAGTSWRSMAASGGSDAPGAPSGFMTSAYHCPKSRRAASVERCFVQVSSGSVRDFPQTFGIMHVRR